MGSPGRRARRRSGRRRAAPLTPPRTRLATAAALLVVGSASLAAQERGAGAPLPAAAVRDTVAAIFRQPAYARSLRESLLDRFLAWLLAWVASMFEAVRGSRTMYLASIALFTAIIVAAIARAAYLGYLWRDQRAEDRGQRTRGSARGGRDPWILAQELAGAGEYTDAAHALYRAQLEALARRERIRLHPSKTVGDYVRDLRQRSSSLFTRFRDFARSYETVVYGVGYCDRERYERLHELAAPIVLGGPEARRG